MLVLGMETSCDETGVALFDSDKGLLAEALYSQVEDHAVFGGVVPELASRDHVRKILPLVQSVLDQAKINTSEINGVAYTAGPGLVGALLVGAIVGRSLAMAWGIPAIAVHHLEGHLLAPMLELDPPKFPFVALLVSGGHTQLIKVAKFGDYAILGDTLDDAIGECFDKVARLLGLGYPGGAALEKLALLGDPAKYQFPRPMVRHQGMDFSFSGLKTYAANTLKKEPDTQDTYQNVARALQDAIVDTLVIKCRRALEFTRWNTLVVAGGVSANQAIRAGLTQLLDKKNGKAYFPRHKYCTDNGAMIAYAGCQRLMRGEHNDLSVKVFPRWPLVDLTVNT